MKKIVLLNTYLLLLSCSIFPTHKIKLTPLTNAWTVGVIATSYATVINYLASTDNSNTSNSHKTIVSVDFTLITSMTSNPYMCKNPKYNSIDVEFIYLNEADKYTYTFDSSSVWITSKNGKKYHLQAISKRGGSAIAYQTYNLTSPQDIGNGTIIYKSNRFHYFKTPLLCEQLEGATFEMGGIYKNGQELPPIKFRINYINDVQK